MQGQSQQTTKQNSVKSSNRVKGGSRSYLDQSELHSNQDQEEFNQASSQMSKTQINLAADRLRNLIQSKIPTSAEKTESEPTKNFVVPDHLIAGVAELKEGYPDASDEELANILKYS